MQNLVRAFRRFLAAILGVILLPANLLAVMPGCGSHHEPATAEDAARANVHASHAVFGDTVHVTHDGGVDDELVAGEHSDRQHGPLSPAFPPGQLCSVSMTCIGAALLDDISPTQRGSQHDGAVPSNFRTFYSLPRAPETPPPRG